MTNKETEEFIGLFESTKKVDKDYQKYVKMSLEKELDKDEDLRDIFDQCIFRALELYKDIKGATHIFRNQQEAIKNLTEYLSWELDIKEPWKKYANNKKVKIFDVLDVARNKDNHPIKHNDKNLFILYKQCINDGHITFIVKLLEGIMLDRLNELTPKDKEKIIALDPNNIIWLENMKTFIKPFYKLFKQMELPQYSGHTEQMKQMLDFELTPENVVILKKKNKRYMKVMDGTISHANGFEYKLNKINVAEQWNPNADNSKDFGGFDFSTEDKILRWLLRGDTIYDVDVPLDAEIIEVDNKNTPNGVFRTNKIIVNNPRKITEEIVMDLYLKSEIPEKTYFQCLTFLSLRNYAKVCKQIIADKVNDGNIDLTIETFENFFDLKEEDKNDIFKEVSSILSEIKNKLLINQFIDREPYIKKITDDKVINITGESGSGKSYYCNKFIEDDNYILVDTDEVFSRFENSKGITKELGVMFRNKYKELPNICDDFDIIYKDILDYLKNSNKTIVIDTAQFRNIKDYSLLKGNVIIIRTCINKCYERCIQRYIKNHKGYTDEELNKFKNKKIGMYKWYKSLNTFIEKIDKL